MESVVTAFPKPGTKLTYAKARKAYDDLEEAMLAKVYSKSFMPNVRMHDLMWEVEGVADKHSIDEIKEIYPLRKAMIEFTSERTALANGVDGERFYLLDNDAALARHDETHLFEVKTDGAKL